MPNGQNLRPIAAASLRGQPCDQSVNWSSLFMESLISIPTKGPIDRKGRVRTLETLLSLAAIATQSETKKRSNSYATYGVRLYAR